MLCKNSGRVNNIKMRHGMNVKSPVKKANETRTYVPVLHSVSYAGAWPSHARLGVDEFLQKAVELGFEHVALVAKQPHVSPLEYDGASRKVLKARIRELGLEAVALMGYTDFTAGLERPGIPSAEMNAAYVGSLAKLASDLVKGPRMASRESALWYYAAAAEPSRHRLSLRTARLAVGGSERT